MPITKGEDCMPKLGIAIDESALTLLRKHAGSPRRVGALIAKLIQQYPRFKGSDRPRRFFGVCPTFYTRGSPGI